MDVVIVSTNDQVQEDFWQRRLREMRGIICKPDALVIAVEEDWAGGAGNALGTLYAYHKAQEKAKFLYRTDLYEKQKQGASVAIYHTAGKGTRLYPLTASELNNKSAVKLPSNIGKGNYLTLLEAVILQTAKMGENRPGRLSVFWGDQIFLQSRDFQYSPKYHVDILSSRRPWPTKRKWHEQHLDNYGLIIQDDQSHAFLLEKVDYPSLKKFVSRFPNPKQCGMSVSLGSFSLSAPMTFALLREYEQELMNKQGKLDTDFHFWMPLTLDHQTFMELSKNKPEAEEQFSRMEKFKQRFCKFHDEAALFGTFDIGKGGLWWDYGTLKKYYQNSLKLISSGSEGKAMRLFFRMDPGKCDNSLCRVIKDETSCLVNCRIGSGKIVNSVLVGVEADSIDIKDSVVINSSFCKLQADKCLIYQVRDQDNLVLDPETVRADVILPDSGEHLKFHSKFSRDSKADWHLVLPSNPLSYADFYDKIQSK